MTTSLVILLSLVFLTHGQATYNEVKDFCAGFTDCNKCATAIGPTVSTSTSTSSSSPCIWCLNAGKNKVSTSSSSRFRTTTTTPAPPSGDPFSPPVGSCIPDTSNRNPVGGDRCLTTSTATDGERYRYGFDQSSADECPLSEEQAVPVFSAVFGLVGACVLCAIWPCLPFYSRKLTASNPEDNCDPSTQAIGSFFIWIGYLILKIGLFTAILAQFAGMVMVLCFVQLIIRTIINIISALTSPCGGGGDQFSRSIRLIFQMWTYMFLSLWKLVHLIFFVHFPCTCGVAPPFAFLDPTNNSSANAVAGLIDDEFFSTAKYPGKLHAIEGAFFHAALFTQAIKYLEYTIFCNQGCCANMVPVNDAGQPRQTMQTISTSSQPKALRRMSIEMTTTTNSNKQARAKLSVNTNVTATSTTTASTSSNNNPQAQPDMTALLQMVQENPELARELMAAANLGANGGAVNQPNPMAQQYPTAQPVTQYEPQVPTYEAPPSYTADSSINDDPIEYDAPPSYGGGANNGKGQFEYF
eukprot:TRINITY_DN3856_c0_g1_i2.p1 TRINITY_DN3856_c0_g1~~TRINITY_DN3856_c0_g1_i2.p1  ORF type:complete len:532 (+),score=103.69 TRINITY_DN3856_c0_g1_i2:22-1596(+)